MVGERELAYLHSIILARSHSGNMGVLYSHVEREKESHHLHRSSGTQNANQPVQSHQSEYFVRKFMSSFNLALRLH